MALIQIGSAGNMMGQVSNALGSNAVMNALGLDTGSLLTPSKFLTKFSPSTVFSYRSLAYEIRNSKNFDVIFHWHPRTSQIRSMFANAFSTADTTDINLLVRSIRMPNLENIPVYGNDTNSKFRASMPGLGVNGTGVVSMTFLNTEFSYVNHCFYQWLSETESPFWLYGPTVSPNIGSAMEMRQGVGSIFGSNKAGNLSDVVETMHQEMGNKLIYLMSESETAPFTRADIQIKNYSGNMKELHSIWFFGAYPMRIQMERLDNNPVGQNDLEGHVVDFTFDSMCISSPFVYDSGMTYTNKVADAFGGTGLSNSAAWTAGLYDDTLTQIGNTYLAKASRKLNKIMSRRGSNLSGKLMRAQNRLTA